MSEPAFIPIAPADPLKTAWFDCSDFGNAKRLVAVAAGKLVWVEDLECFAFYDGKRWSLERGNLEAQRLAHAVIRRIDDEVLALVGLQELREDALEKALGWACTPDMLEDRIKTLRGHAVKSGNAGMTAGMLKQVRSLVSVFSTDFDKDPLVLNVETGTLRFFEVPQKGGPARWDVRETPHAPEDMLMQLASVEFDPAAKCPMWEERLVLVQPDAEQRAIFPRMYGQCLTGLTDCEEFYVHKGRGGDGKTKTHEVIAAIMGSYHRKAGVKTFLQATFQKSGAEHRRDLVDLSGDIRFVLTDEPPPRVTWDGELLKQVTGGSTITAFQAGGKKPVVYKPHWKLFVEVNPLPNMPGDDKGFRRRLRVILWSVDLTRVEGGFEPPELLRKRLLTEKSGVLNWLIAGCLEWLGDRRVPVCAAEAMALQNFWAESSPIGEWIDEECDLTDAEAETPSKALWEAFKDWMERNEVPSEKWNTTRFGRDLMQRQIMVKKDRRGNKVRKGIRFRAVDQRQGAAGGEAIFPAGGPGREAAPGWDDLDGDDLLGG